MKKKGFTLIELLAVIVILALIALITIPVVGNIIENSRKEAFKRSVEGLSREYEYKEVQTDTKLGEVDACTLQDPCKIEGTIKRDTNGEVVLYVTDGRYCTNGKIGAFTVVNGTCGIGSGIEEITFNNPNYEVNYSKNDQVIDITPNGGSGDFTYTKLSEKNSLNEDTNYVEVNGSTLIVKPSISVGTYIVSVRIKDNETQLEKEVNIVIKIESVNISNIEIDDIESIDYDGTEQTPEVVVISNGSILEKDVDYEVEYINSINAGTATIKITGKGNYVGEITKTFTINKVNAPNTSVVGASLDYNGLNQSLITSVNVSNSHIYYSVGTPLNSSNYLTLGSETKPTRSDAGTYTVYYYAPADNYNEVSGSVTVTINPITLNIPPQPSDKNYTGGSQVSGITCPTGSTASGDTSATYPGTYTQTCTLTNGNYKWNDNSTTPKSVTWVIKGVAKEGTCNTLTYNGNSQTLAQGGEHVTYVNNSGVNVGDYIVTVNADEGFKFIDGTTSKTLRCTIDKITINVPTSPSDKNYTVSNQASGITCPTGSIASGDTSAVNAGTYTQTCTINNGNYKWNDNTTTPKNISWTILPRILYAYFHSNTYNYDYEGRQINVYNYCPTGTTASGTLSATEPGTYSVTCTINNGNYKWDDNTTTPKNYTWIIRQKTLYAPSAPSSNKVYTGSSQESEIYCPSESITSGTQSAINAGTYTVTCTLPDTTHYKWSDGTTSPKNINWTIDKRLIYNYYHSIIDYGDGEGEQINPNRNTTLSGVPFMEGESITLELGFLREGDYGSYNQYDNIYGFTCTSEDPSIATCSVSGNRLTITSKMKSTFAGEANLIFSVTNSNYRLYSYEGNGKRSETIRPYPVCPSSSKCKYIYISDNSNKCWTLNNPKTYTADVCKDTSNYLRDNEFTSDYTTLNKDIFLAFVYNDNNARVLPLVCANIDNNVRCIYGGRKLTSSGALLSWQYNYDMAKIYNYRSGYDIELVWDGESISKTIGNYKFSVYESSGNVTIKNVSGNYGCTVTGYGGAHCGSM